MSTQPMSNSAGPIKIFISHAHGDHVVAEMLIDFLLTEFNLSRHEIRCTSAIEAAHGLPLGKSIAEQLQKDISDAELVIGLLSYFGLESVWVKFELGAAWGKQKNLLPLIGPGFKNENERLGPLGYMLQLSVDDETFETTLMTRFHQEMDRMGVGATNNPLSLSKLALFVKTYRNYGGLDADFSATNLTLISPQAGDTVGGDIAVKFEVENIPENGFIWFGVMPNGKDWMFWPKEEYDEGENTVIFTERGMLPPKAMAICAIGVGIAGNAFLKNWLEKGRNGKGWPGLSLKKKIRDAEQIPGAHQLDIVENLSLRNE